MVVLVLALVFAAYGVAALIGSVTRSSPPVPPRPDAPTIPPLVRTAYVQAAERVQTGAPECSGLTWTLVAGVGAVESRHATDREVRANGDVTPAILGPRLDGSGVGGNLTPVYDTDGGQLDADTKYDRAVGPMQFLPETWTSWAWDGNDDGRADPQNIFDAALTAAAYLCGNDPVDLADPAQRDAAIYRYNVSASYRAEVVGYATAYAEAG